jgi:hypothetical protein
VPADASAGFAVEVKGGPGPTGELWCDRGRGVSSRTGHAAKPIRAFATLPHVVYMRDKRAGQVTFLTGVAPIPAACSAGGQLDEGLRRRYPYFMGEEWREGKMFLNKAVYSVLICAGFAYVAFWTAFFVHAAMAQH